MDGDGVDDDDCDDEGGEIVAVLMMTPVYAGASNHDEGNRQLTSATLMGTGNETSRHGY